MLKTYLSCFISGLLLLGPTAQSAVGSQKKDKQTATLEDVKIKVAKLGVGEKAKATITLKDGTKTKGYVARAGEDDFVMRDRKTVNSTTIRYADVAKVDSNRGHSTAKHLAIGLGIGAAITVGVLFIIISRLDD
jgi:uncharacterized protein YqfA (UPF0365 family)